MCTCPINSTQEKPGFKVIFSYTATSKAAYLTGHTVPPHYPPPKKKNSDVGRGGREEERPDFWA